MNDFRRAQTRLARMVAGVELDCWGSEFDQFFCSDSHHFPLWENENLLF